MSTVRVRLNDETIKRNRIVKKIKRTGRKRVTEKGIDLSLMEAALRQSNGLVTKAAESLCIPVSTLKTYIKRYVTLRDAMFESRSKLVDEAEDSLRLLVEQKNLTAVIFTLKCLGQERGYIDTPKKENKQQAPIIINLMPASSGVKQLPSVTIGKEGKRNRKMIPVKLDEDVDLEEARLIEVENDI